MRTSLENTLADLSKGFSARQCLKMIRLANPVKNSGEEEEGLERGFGLFVSGGDTTESFDSGEEVFDSMAFAVMSPVARSIGFCSLPFRDAGTVPVDLQFSAEGGAVIAFVGDDDRIAQTGHQLRRRGDVVDIARSDEQFQGPSAKIDQGVEFGVSASSAGSNSLNFSRRQRRSSILMNAHVGAVNESKRSLGILGENLENARPDLFLGPPSEPSVNGLPRSKSLGQITPRIATSQDMEDRFDDLPKVSRRSANRALRCSTRSAPINFLSLRQALSDSPRGYKGFIPDPSGTPKEYKR